MGQIVDCDFEDLKLGKRVKIEFRKLFKKGHSGQVYCVMDISLFLIHRKDLTKRLS